MIYSITGFIGSGKDTCANHLIENHGFKKMAFADPLKDVVAAAFNWDREMLQGDTKDSRKARNVVDEKWSEVLRIPNFTPRKALQFVGTNVFKKHVSSKFWIQRTVDRIKSEQAADPNVRIVITDCRYHDEFQALKNLGASSIFVDRGNKPAYYSISSLKSPWLSPVKEMAMNLLYSDVHDSEWKWNDLEFDYTVTNNSSLGNLHNQLDAIMRKQ